MWGQKDTSECNSLEIWNLKSLIYKLKTSSIKNVELEESNNVQINLF